MSVLVSASSRHGSTMEIAHLIVGILADRGIEAEVREPDDVTTLDGVDAIVLGSGVYMGRWLEPAKAFVERFAPAFSTRRVWLYSSGPLGDPAKPEVDPVDAAAMMETTHALDHRVFPGRLVASELGLGERLIVKGVRAPYGDFRPWPEITDWVEGIAADLAASPVATA